MNSLPQQGKLRRDERVIIPLSRLFEGYGYKKYHMSQFEEYQLYMKNKNFLGTENVITFSDYDGKLLALKPDVTLSIVKNTNASRERSKKVYYLENVFRFSRQDKQYREISQMGLEWIGDADGYASAEVFRLACEALAAVKPQFVIDLSHMGIVSGLLDSLEVPEDLRESALNCIRRKNRDGLRALARQLGLSTDESKRLERTALLSGPLSSVLGEAEKLCTSSAMADSAAQLRNLSALMAGTPFFNRIRLDFSMINDIAYYNGFIFQGFVEGVPRQVLSGGRYDNLMKRFGRDAGGIGFALYLDALQPLLRQSDSLDAVVLYDEVDSTLLEQVSLLVERGMRVSVQKSLPDDVEYRTVYRWRNGKLEEVTGC